jgi:hypothetical protein
MENNIQEQVLKKIRTGEISKRSRFYFVVQIILTTTFALITFALSVFVLSFIVFSIHESGEQFLLGFGQKGFVTLLQLFPWFTLMLVIILLLILEWLIRSFKFAYRVSILRIFLSIALITIVGSASVNFTPLHMFLEDRADHDSLPILGEAYENLHDSHQPQGAFRGTVRFIATSTFTISHDDHDNDADDGNWTIAPPNGFDMHSILVGDDVYVGGTLTGDVVHAYDIQQFSENH